MSSTSDRPLLDAIDADVAAHLCTRRAALARGALAGGTLGAAFALGSVPVALAALARDAGAQGADVTGVLEFALILEIFEDEFYKAVLGTSASAAQNAAFAPVRALVPPAALASLQQIQRHEASHVAFLRAQGAMNRLNLSATSFDFTGARGAGNGPFARATRELPFLLLVAQAAEDTGVRAYKGQAANLRTNPTALEAALRIHSVEARHAARIRRLRRAAGASAVKFSGTVTGGGAAAAGAGDIASPPAGAVTALQAIYAGQGLAAQGGVTLASLPNLPAGMDAGAFGEAFDEPLTRAQVRDIVQPFFIPDIPA